MSDVYEMVIPQAIQFDVAGEPDSPRLLLEYGGYKAFDHLLQFMRSPTSGQVVDGYIMKKWADLRPVPEGYDFFIID